MEASLEVLRAGRDTASNDLPPERSIDSRHTLARGHQQTAGVSSSTLSRVNRRRLLWTRFQRLFRRRRRSLFVLVILCELAYIFVSVPLRCGFLFDPYALGEWRSEWTNDLTILTVLDVLADLAAIANFYEIFDAQHRAQAASAAHATAPVVSRHNAVGATSDQPALSGAAAPTRVRCDSLLMNGKRSSFLVAWSLNTLVPTIKLKGGIHLPIVLEMLAMAPIEILSIVLGPNSLHVLRAVKMLRLYRLPECLRELRTLHAQSQFIQSLDFTGNALLAKTVARGIALCHLTACGYMAIAHFECGVDLLQCAKAHTGVATTRNSNSIHRRRLSSAPSVSSVAPGSHAVSAFHYTCWAIEDQLVGTSLARKYGRSVYWSSRTLVTLAYYDATPVTDVETLYVIAVLILGAIFSTSVLATFLFIFRYRNSRLQEFMAHVDSASEFMKTHSFPADVREGVLSFYRNAWATHQGLYHGEIVKHLPEHLSASVYSVLKVQRLQNVVFLAKESIEFVNTLAQNIELAVFSPKDWVIEKVADGMFFVLRGTVLLDSKRSRLGQAPRFAKTGDHFAEACLLYPGRSAEDDCARAQTFCELYKLPQGSFFSTLHIFYRKSAHVHLARMRSMLTRRDQQEQKMKRMLGRSQKQLSASTASAGSYQVKATGALSNDDRDTDVASSTIRRWWSRMRRRQQKRLQLPWIMPGSSFRHFWEYWRFLLLLFVAYEVPLFLVFDSTSFPFGDRPLASTQSISSVFVELFFMVDFVLRARYFAYVDQLAMIPVTDPGYIFAAYKEDGMWLDLVAVVPVALVAEFSVSRVLPWLAAFRGARLLRLRHLPQAVKDFTHARGMSSKAHDAFSIFLYVTLTIHVSGCAWFLMARFNMSPGDFCVYGEGADDHSSMALIGSLTRDQCLRDAGLHGNCSWALFDAYGQIGTAFPTEDPTSVYTGKFAYLRAIYWSIVELTTIGYGDIVAFATSETYFAALWAFVGAIVNYGVVGAMSNIISSLTASSRHHLEKMNNINLVLAHFRVSERVRVQIRRFYHQQFYVQKVSSEAKLLEHLPAQLRHRISLELHSESVRKVPLFVELEGEHSRLLYSLTGLFRRRLYQRGDVFFPDSSASDEMVVVVHGRANVFSKRAGPVPVGALSDGSCYGVCELILRKPHQTSVVAASIVDVSVITYTSFSGIERRFPAEIQVLRLRALQQHVAESLSLEAIVNNIKEQPTVAKFTDKCTGMFVDKDDWASHVRKTQLRLYWDLLLFAVDMYNAFQIPFRVCFLLRPGQRTWLLLVLLDVGVDALLALDVLLKLYYFECEGGLRNLLTREHRDVAYAKRSLKWDILSCAPLYYVGTSYLTMSICRLPRLIRLRHVAEVFDSLTVRIQQRFSSGGNISAYLGPFKLALWLIYAAHFAGCVFYLISITEHNALSWIEHDHIVHQEHGSIGVLYLRSYYWALTTLTLVGSREIVPLGVSSTLWTALTSLCCTFIVGHIVGELSDLILDLDKTGKELKEREDRFDHFAKEHSLPASIRTRALHYLRFQHAYLGGMDIYETFRDLSPNLRVQLMLDLHGDMLRGLCIAPFLSDSQTNALAIRLRSELFIAGDTVVVEGNLGHKLFIVKCGTAMVLWKTTGTVVATLQAGSLFGEVAFFLRGQRRIATVQATTSSEMLVVDRRAWDELLALSPPEEADKTEQATTSWVCDCLKGYNVMTVEIVKSIKLGDAVPPTIQELHTYNSAMRQQSTGRSLMQRRRTLVLSPLGKRNRDSVGTIQEKQVRHLLRKAVQHEHASTSSHGGRHGQPVASRLWEYAQLGVYALSMGLFCRGSAAVGRLRGKAIRQARVYVATGNSHESGTNRHDETGDGDDGDEGQHPISGPESVKQLNGAWTVRSLPQVVDPLASSSGRQRSHAREGSGGYIGRMRQALIKSRAGTLKHGASTMQINPVSTSMREYYGDGQLTEMEAECWRRFKVSLFLAETFIDRQHQAAARLEARNIVMSGGATRQATTGVNGLRSGSDGDVDAPNEEDNSSSVESKPVRQRVREARKTFSSAMLSGETANSPTLTAVANDGMRWLANYETRNRSGGQSGGTRREDIVEDRYRSFNKTETAGMMAPAVFKAAQRRVLKRSQSLPIFDRYFAIMAHAELQQSSANNHESKLSLGFEMLQRCRQSELSFLFQLYLAWLKKKRAWSQTRIFMCVFGKTDMATVRPGAKSLRDLTRLQAPDLRHSNGGDDEGAKRDHVESTAAKTKRGDTPSNTGKAEAFLTLLTRYYRLWEGVVVAVAIVYAVALPFFICFMHDTDTSVSTAALRRWIGAIIFMDLFCIIDLVLKYTAFQGVLHMDEGGPGDSDEHGSGARAPHARRLCIGGASMHLVSEVFAAIPVDLIVFLPGMRVLRQRQWYYLSMLQLNKITRIYDATQASERLAQFLASDLSLSVDDSLLRFARSLGGYVLATHWIGCVWFRVSMFAYEMYDASWISTARMLAVDQFESVASVPMTRRYLRSLYFSVQSATTTFYGDIASLNVLELVVEIFVIFLCIFLFGALVGAQGERIEAKYKRRMVFEQSLAALFHFLKSNDVPRPVRQRLRLYYTNTWLTYHGQDDLDGVEGLSTLLVQDVVQYTMRRFAAKVSILRSCDERFLRSLLTRLKHVICSSNEAVVRKGDVDRSMYFIARGKVLVKGAGFELIKGEGDFFGELSLLYGIPRSATCSSLGVSLLYVLQLEAYEKLLADFPEYRQQNRREWVIVSTVLKSGESRFRSIIDLTARMEGEDWVVIDDIIRKAKRLK